MIGVTRLTVEMVPGSRPQCPSCRKNLGDRLRGIYETTCPKCKTLLRFVALTPRTTET